MGKTKLDNRFLDTLIPSDVGVTGAFIVSAIDTQLASAAWRTPVTGTLLAANNLSDVSNTATALATLGGASKTGNNVFTGTNSTDNYIDFTNSGNAHQMRFQNFLTQDFFISPSGSNPKVMGYDFLTEIWSIDNSPIVTQDNADGLGVGSGMANLVEDTTPQLGGNLDRNGFEITGLVIGADIQAYSSILQSTTASFTTAKDSAITANTLKNSYPSGDSIKLAGIEVGATADQTASEIKVSYESNSNTNVFTDAEKTKVSLLSGTNTGDQDLSGKQDVLISGTNIKTINGSTVLGSGDLTVAGSGGVNISGTPVAGQVAQWTDATTAEGVSTTGTGNYVKATSPTLVTPNLGTPSVINLNNGAGLPISAGTTGILPINRIATGTPTGAKYVRDDGTLAIPSSSINLSQVLLQGNSAGVTDLNMSDNSIQNVVGLQVDNIFTNNQPDLVIAVSGIVSVSGSRISLVGTPTVDGDAVNKLYVDSNNTATTTIYDDTVTALGETTVQGAIEVVALQETDLGYTPGPTNGIVTNSRGDDATLPLSDATNAGLQSPSQYVKVTKAIITDASVVTNGVAINTIVAAPTADIEALGSPDANTLYIPNDSVTYHYPQFYLGPKGSNVLVATKVAYWRAPYAGSISALNVYMDVAGTSTGITVDVNINGTTTLSTKLTTDATEQSSSTATTPYVISGGGTFSAGDIITFDIDAIPTGGQWPLLTMTVIEN